MEVNFTHFLSDKKNTPYTARMLMHVNKSAPGSPAGGIHWHVSDSEKVEYYATDDKRQDIPWTRVTNLKDGTSRDADLVIVSIGDKPMLDFLHKQFPILYLQSQVRMVKLLVLMLLC